MKKGFTLIELLAVIVILAVIAVIATPIVLDIINDAKQSSKLRSVDNILKGAELYVSKGLMDKENLNGNIYGEVIKIIDGENPDSGNIYANSKGEIAFSFKYDNYCYTKGYTDEDIKVEKNDTCITPIDYLMVANQTNGEGETFFEGKIAKSSVEKVYTKTTNKVPSGVIDSWDVSEAQNGSIMAWYVDEDNNGLYELYLGQDGGVKANPDSSKIFNYFINAVEIDLSNLDTSNVTDMKGMFQQCRNLIKLDINRFNTLNVTNMSGMFNECQNLTTLDLSSFDTSNVTTMLAMFQHCKELTTIDLSSFDTSNVLDMGFMFNHCEILTTLDLSSFDTSNVTDMKAMFQACSKLTTLDLSGFNTTNVTDMSYMFYSLNSLTTLDLSGFNTTNVTDMSYMFYSLNSLTSLDLSSFDISKVTIHSNMFKSSTVSSVIVKDNNAKTFIEARLTDVGLSGTVTIN